jgi:hypothetical protein
MAMINSHWLHMWTVLPLAYWDAYPRSLFLGELNKRKETMFWLVVSTPLKNISQLGL